MLIGVDAGALGVKDEKLKAGVYQYSINLLTHLSEIDKKNIYYLYSFYPIQTSLMRNLGKNFINKVITPKLGWFTLRLPLALNKDKVDVFLSLSQALPKKVSHSFKTVGFIHALDFYPEFHSEKNLRKIEKNTQSILEKSDVIVAASRFLKKEISKKNKKISVKVVPMAVSNNFKPKGKRHKEKYLYFLFVGSIKPSKNISNIIEAFSKFHSNQNKHYKLILIGSDLWSDENLSNIIKKENLKKHIEFIGSLPNEKLPEYYRGALAFLSPSLYEGFGITILESMSCGTPVIVGNRTAEKEIVNKGGILVNPSSVSEIVEAMTKISNKKYKKGALDDSKKFSYKKHARNILRIINNL